jgi:ABC-type polysaccharide/polyol phosphate export permease
MTKPLQLLPTRLAHSIMLMTGGFAVVLGLLVLLGWHTHNVHLLQMIPTFAPMQYNAALGLLLCGSGVQQVLQAL